MHHDADMAHLLALAVQAEVAWRNHNKWLRAVWFLDQTETPFLVRLALSLAAMVFSPGAQSSVIDRQLSGNRAAIGQQSIDNRAAIEQQSSGNRTAIGQQSDSKRTAIGLQSNSNRTAHEQR